MLKNLSNLKWFFREHRIAMIFVLINNLFMNLFTIASPIILGRAVDAIAGKTITAPMLRNYLLILIFCAIALNITGYLWSYYIFRNSRIIEYRLLNVLMNKILYMPRTFFEKFLPGELMTIANTSLESIQEFVSFGFMAFFDSIMYLPTVLIIMGFYISWKLTFFACIPLIIVAIMTNLSGKYIYNFYNKQQDAMSKLNDNVLEGVTGIRLVRAYNLEERIFDTFDQITDDVYNRSLDTEKVQNIFWPISNVFLAFSYAFSLILGANMIRLGEISLGEMITFNIFLGYLTWPMYAIGEFINVSQRASSATNKFYNVLDTKNDRIDSEIRLQPLDAFGDIVFSNYHFQYPSSPKENLNGIDLVLKKGKTLGIAGKTGSGKSTLIKQLLMQYPLGSGNIRVGSQDLANIETASWMQHISYVSQDTILFSDSIKENVLFGLVQNTDDTNLSDALQERIRHSIFLANLEKDVDSFRDGLDTQVGERGIAVSGGQKQRVSIARALIKNADLLILDDSLSAVDAKTETKILDNIKQNRQGKSNIIISHRLSAISHADEIIVLDDGRIIERGTHDTLMQSDTWYKKQYDIQKLEEEKHDEE